MKKNDFHLYRKTVFLATAAITVIVIIIGIVIWASRTEETEASRIPVQKQLLDFQFPDSYKNLWDNTWKPSIIPEYDWNWDKIQDFWLDTEEIGVKILEVQNDDLLKETFESFR